MNAQQMGPATPPAKVVHIGRSDAHWYPTDEINTKLKSAGPARHVSDPIPQNFNQIFDDESRVKLAQWKVVVGTGLSEELGWPKDSQYQVVFPDGFCLRWQNIAGLSKEACMYGHPQDCSDDFVYRRPYEFIPHALWLLSESQDHRDCPCKPCHRATGRQVPRTFKAKMDEQAAALEATKLAAPGADSKATKKTTKSTAAAKRKTAAATASASATSSPGPEQPAKPAKAPAAPKTTKKAAAAKTQQTPIPAPVIPPAPAAAPASAPQPAPQAAPAVPPTPTAPATPAPPARHPALNDEPTLFRRGEMVWYQQGPAWRIGLIRHVGPEPVPNYTVIPLGHALLDVPDVPKQQSQMRPFLTFSVPSISIPLLQESFFSQVNWQALLADPTYANRSEVIGLEASKLAALEIDGSWSTFNRLASGPKQPKNQSSYGGVFLGAEMIRLGDPVRPKDKNRGSLLEVTEISVTAATSVPNPADPAGAPSTTQYALSFRGIEYEATLVPEHGRIAAQPEGTIFAKDTAFRTAAAKASGAKQKCVWTIKSWDTTWQERDVAGRSYVTDELIGVTQGLEAVQTAHSTGNFLEASSYLNNRMQNTAARNFGRRPNRRTTVGAAIAAAQPLVLGEGVIEE